MLMTIKRTYRHLIILNLQHVYMYIEQYGRALY